jgi:hypothetical protein
LIFFFSGRIFHLAAIPSPAGNPIFLKGKAGLAGPQRQSQIYSDLALGIATAVPPGYAKRGMGTF